MNQMDRPREGRRRRARMTEGDKRKRGTGGEVNTTERERGPMNRKRKEWGKEN